MKQFIAAAIAGIAAADSLPKCMYCKRNDDNSGFLNSWSYCQATDTCLHNAWNYIQRECEDGWNPPAEGSARGREHKQTRQGA